MDADLLRNAGMVAGIGGIALAVLMTVFREVIRKNIFPRLDPQAGYRLLRLVLFMTWSVAIIGVGAWFMTKRADNPGAAGTPLKEFTIVGLVTDAQENGIAEASISVVGKGSFVRSDSSGAFSLTTWLGDERDVTVRITKDGYRPKTEPVTLPTKNLIIALERASTADAPAVAAQATGPAPANTLVARPEGPDNATNTTPIAAPARSQAFNEVSAALARLGVNLPGNTADATPRGAISVQYTGDAMGGCVLNLGMNVGGRDFAPTGNPYAVNDVALGSSQYTISGSISCPSPTGPVSCIATGAGPLLLRNGGLYNVVWQNTALGQCQVGLVAAN